MSKPKKRSTPKRPARKRPARRIVHAVTELKSWTPPTIDSLLDPQTRGKLLAFCAAHHGADPATVIDKAVCAFMVDDMAANEGVGKSYRQEDQE